MRYLRYRVWGFADDSPESEVVLYSTNVLSKALEYARTNKMSTGLEDTHVDEIFELVYTDD